MTYKEMYMKMHPEMTPEEMDGFSLDHCPTRVGGMEGEDPDFCGSDPIPEVCPRCWDREVPGTEPVGIPIDEEFRRNLRMGFIKDSGARTEFPSGAVRDIQEGKGRCDLMPLDVVAGLLGGFYNKPDSVLDPIDVFIYTGSMRCLYDALEYFRNMWGVDFPTMFLEVAKHFEEGAKKYGENNWQKGIPVRCYIDSAVRHYLKWLRGDTDEPHDRAFCWNIMCAIWTCKHKPELNTYAQITCPVCGETVPNGDTTCSKCQIAVKGGEQ